MSRRRGRHLTPEQHTQLIEAIQSSKSIYPTAVAATYGVSRRYVWALCRTYGTPMIRRVPSGRINLLLAGVDHEETERRRELQGRVIDGDRGALETFAHIYRMRPIMLRGQRIGASNQAGV